jgi:hypothetical protein
MAYVAGRSWIEYLRVDHANHILGLRLNDWTSIFVFTFALVAFVISALRHPGRESVVEFSSVAADAEPAPARAEAAQPADASATDGHEVVSPENRTPTEGATP